MNGALEQCREFLAAIFEPGDVMEFRTLGPVTKRWGTLSELQVTITELMRLNAGGAQCYFGANPRKRCGESKEDGVSLARCVFADFDGGVTVEEAWERIKAAGLPMPTVTIVTGGGVHCWWRLDQPVIDAKQWSRLQKAVAEALSSDRSVHDWPRIMRLPGFVNHKYEHKPVAELVDVDATRVYSLAVFSRGTKAMSSRARVFVERGETVAGGGRRETMFAVACDLRDSGWSPEDAVAVIMPRMRQCGLSAVDVADCPRQIRNAWKREPRAVAVTPEPAASVSLVGGDAEHHYLAGLLHVMRDSPDEARELADLVEPEMLSAAGTADVHAAVRAAFEHTVHPALADVATAISRRAPGVASASNPVRQLFRELVADEMVAGPQASRLAGEAAAEVAELHQRRRSIELLGDAVSRLRRGDELEGVGELLEQVQAVRSAGPSRGVVTFADAVDEWARHDRVPTVRTLLEPLDDATEGGLPIGGLTTLVAPPQTGKSAMAAQLAVGSLLADEHLRVVYALGEMGVEMFAQRVACVGASLLGRPLVTMHEAGIRSDESRETLRELVREIGDRLTIVEPLLTVERVDEQVRRSGAKFVVIDYLQLMVAASGENRVEQLDGIIGSLRDLAIRRQAAVLVISSMAKATGTGSRIGQFARGTGEVDYASELLYLGVPDDRTDEHGVRAVRWECRKARNLPQVDLELRFDGPCQTFAGAVVPFPEFPRFEPGGTL